jgi:hypothetical protein
MTLNPVPEPRNNVRPLAKPAPSYVRVTPDMAKRLLAHNKVNRNLRAHKVNQYARDMASGNWSLSNDAICVAPDGRLLNGQHRLHAVVKSGVTVTFLVIRNMPADSMSTMDSGVARTAGDVFGRVGAGEKHANLLASTLKQLVLVESGRVYMDSKVQATSHSELAEFLDANPLVRESVAEAAKVKSQIDSPPTPVAVAHWLIAQRNSLAFADLFFDRLAHRVGEPEGSAVHAVDNRLREIRRSRQRFEGRNFIYLFLKGWNYYAADKPVSKLLIVPARNGEFRLPDVARWSRP